MKGRDKFIGVNSIKFSRRFKDDEDCYKYIADIKWGSGYVCKHCGHTHYFPDLHIHIMNIKGWLRGMHHHCTKEQLQGYLDKYHFRYNRRNSMNTIFDLLIKRMVLYKPVRLVNNKLDLDVEV